MPGLSGIEVARHVEASMPQTAVILYTAFGDRALLTEALDAGRAGSCSRRRRFAEVGRGSRTRLPSEAYVDPVLAGVLDSAATEKMMT